MHPDIVLYHEILRPTTELGEAVSSKDLGSLVDIFEGIVETGECNANDLILASITNDPISLDPSHELIYGNLRDFDAQLGSTRVLVDGSQNFELSLWNISNKTAKVRDELVRFVANTVHVC